MPRDTECTTIALTAAERALLDRVARHLEERHGGRWGRSVALRYLVAEYARERRIAVPRGENGAK